MKKKIIKQDKEIEQIQYNGIVWIVKDIVNDIAYLTAKGYDNKMQMPVAKMKYYETHV